MHDDDQTEPDSRRINRPPKSKPHPEEGIDYYIDERGLLVFTEYYLRERGNCCGNGCRHCPYD